MYLTTTETIPGKKVVRHLGLVRGNTIRARHLGHDFMAALRNIVGGEITDYTKMLSESREQALDRMAEQAKALGANAVVGIRFTTSMVMSAAAEILAYGTAVVVE
ncbi:MAG: YbjQ family protein [Candidatus Oleimicrobiaceae bacterium]